MGNKGSITSMLLVPAGSIIKMQFVFGCLSCGPLLSNVTRVEEIVHKKSTKILVLLEI